VTESPKLGTFTSTVMEFLHPRFEYHIPDQYGR